MKTTISDVGRPAVLSRRLLAYSVGFGFAMLGPVRGTMAYRPSPATAHASHRTSFPAFVPAIASPHDTVLLPTQVAPIPVAPMDTGPLALGNTDFSRYTAPGMCLASAQDARDGIPNTLSEWSTQFSLENAETHRLDRLPERVVRVARTCLQRFSADHLSADEDLYDLFALAVMADEDTVAHAIMQRRLTLAPNDSVRFAVLRSSAERYVAAEPARVRAAEAVIAQLVAMGPHAAAPSLYADSALLKLAEAEFNETLLRRVSNNIIAISQTTPLSDIRYDDLPIIYAYRDLAQIAYIEHPDSVTAVLTRAKQDLGRFPNCKQYPDGIPFNLYWQCIDYKTAELAELREIFIPFDGSYYAGSLPPLSAQFWLPKAPATWPPGRGHVSLVLYGGSLMNTCGQPVAVASPADRWLITPCMVLYALVRGWGTTYGDRLAMTFMANARGVKEYSLTLPPAAEADTVNWFFRDYLKLPVTVGVVKDTVWMFPKADGRRFAIDTSLAGKIKAQAIGELVNPEKPGFNMSTQSSGLNNTLALLYDEQGKPIYVGIWNAPVLSVYLSRLFGGIPVGMRSDAR